MPRQRAKSFCIACEALFCCALLFAADAVPRVTQTDLPEDLTGKSVDPFKFSAGRVLVFLFVRTDCPISNRYAPAIQDLAKQFYGHANFRLVYPDADESSARIRIHLADYHYEIPALRDVHHSLVNRAQATITPESAVFDASGKLVYHGRIDNWYEDFGRARATPTTHELRDAIRNALAGRSTIPDHANAVGCYIADLK
jgi:thiol-disulfide isomerase/thioredoxin